MSKKIDLSKDIIRFPLCGFTSNELVQILKTTPRKQITEIRLLWLDGMFYLPEEKQDLLENIDALID